MLPPAIVEAQTLCALIITNPQMFPVLGCGKGQKRILFTCPDRERRAERLTGIARLLAVLLGHSDLLSLSDGRRGSDGRCHPLTEQQLGELLEIIGDEDLEDEEIDPHDVTGMRAMRSALRDVVDAGLVKREQPKCQYCPTAAGGCGERVPKGGTCNCGRRWLWKWRSFPSVITVSKRLFQVLGGDSLVEALEEEQGKRYQNLRDGFTGPLPERNVVKERELGRIERQHLMAAKRVRIDPEQERKEHARLERLYGKKLE